MVSFTTVLALTAICTSAFAATSPPSCPLTDNDGTGLEGIGVDGDFITCNYKGAGTCKYNDDDGKLSSGSKSCPSSLASSPQTSGASDNATFGAATCLPTDLNNSPLTGDGAFNTSSLTCSYQAGDCVYNENGKLTAGPSACPPALQIATFTTTVISCPFGDKNDVALSTIQVTNNALGCSYDAVKCSYDLSGNLTNTATKCPDMAVINQPAQSSTSTSTTATATSTTSSTSTVPATTSSKAAITSSTSPTTSASVTQQPSSALGLTRGSAALIFAAILLSFKV